MATFLILGGTGKTGRRIGQALTSAGHIARLASRHSAVRFDWHDQSTWPAALRGADGLFIVGPGSATDWSPLLTDLLAAAAANGVARAVLLSARAVEFLPDGAVARAEQALRAGPLPWTILRPAHFAQNFTEAMFAPIDGRILAPAGTGAEPFIDIQDIAEVAAAVLAAVSGTPVRFADESDEDHVGRLRASGTPEGYIRWRMAMLGAIKRGEDAYLSDGVQQVLHRPPASFRAWAQREVPAAGWARVVVA